MNHKEIRQLIHNKHSAVSATGQSKPQVQENKPGLICQELQYFSLALTLRDVSDISY